jgi:YD repeat-containing protein
MPAFDGTTFLRDPSMQFLTNTISYDAQGHAVSTNERGRLSGMGYDAHDNCNAVITNADKSHAFYTSFEDANYDGWAVTPSDISGLDWVTGAYSYYMDGNAAAGINSLTHTLDAAATYKLSFWSKGGTPYVYSTASGGAKTFYTPVTTYANAATGWTYLEYLVPQVANVTVTNSYTGLTGPYTSLYLDELRLYPQGAFMSTRTYDPAFGVTSECDENNRIRYFQYDGFNRLKYLLDADRNVVKTYEYNFMTP